VIVKPLSLVYFALVRLEKLGKDNQGPLFNEPHLFEKSSKKLIIIGHIIGQLFTVTVQDSEMKIFHPFNESLFFHPLGEYLFQFLCDFVRDAFRAGNAVNDRTRDVIT
jgi:hypothetical protein